MSDAVAGLYRERLPSDTAPGLAPVGWARAGAANGPTRRSGTVRFEGIGKTYRSKAGEVRALEAVDAEVEAGSIFGIIGRSGAGKSSLIRLVNRLETPTVGRVLVDGQDVAALDGEALIGLRRRVGMVFQHFNLLQAKTVRENVALPLLVAGVARAERERRVDAALALVGLDEKHDSYPARLSGGQKQRVGIARALVNDPEILLCDEATSALDPETTLSILGLLRDINRRLGLTILLITHEMSVIREICTKVLVLDRGRTVETGPVWQVFGNPRHEATRALLKPLTRGLPEDIAERLGSRPAGNSASEAVVEFFFAGEREPDIAALAALFDGPMRVLSASLDRIDGRTQGRLLVAAPLPAAVLPERPELFSQAKVLGYV
ncbi:methionine ABC transporter ATP-binding protein [Aureimonas leprariae]|uniref:Cell division ATP-binding protein FtsE n=1 Tax=Plantimonas leprariae TaxID=2615207 RepID=A0A7V7PNJ7_9HYPH|nr:ATP-binding cassette domain-containing protein [Aureimonas leprariae]KAB0679100.1 ATP-binding cassette domain-containing protein [Aureimonas leprariae]